MPPEQVGKIHGTILHDYYFLWPDPNGAACIALGFGSLYNHSWAPNANIIMDVNHSSFEIHCIKDIEAGTEIFIDYTDNSKGENALWFEPV